MLSEAFVPRCGHEFPVMEVPPYPVNKAPVTPRSLPPPVRPPGGPVQPHPPEVPAGRHQGVRPLPERHRGGVGAGGPQVHPLPERAARRARDLPARRLPGCECPTVAARAPSHPVTQSPSHPVTRSLLAL